MQLVSIKAKRTSNGIEDEASRVVVGQVPDNPRYLDAICVHILPQLIEAGVVPPLDDQPENNNQVG